MQDFENISVNPLMVESIEIEPEYYKDLADGSTFVVVITMESGRKHENPYNTAKEAEESRDHMRNMIDTYINPGAK